MSILMSYLDEYGNCQINPICEDNRLNKNIEIHDMRRKTIGGLRGNKFLYVKQLIW